MKSFYERCVLVAIALLTMAIMAVSIYYERQLSNQKAMFYQLQAIRTSVNLFKAINKTNVKDLATLTQEEYTFPNEDMPRRYLTGATVDPSGKILDPFGNAYSYDIITGWVRSTTDGYEFW